MKIQRETHKLEKRLCRQVGQAIVDYNMIEAGDKVKIAAERAYEVVERIRFDGMQYRRDIGHRAFGRR